MDQHKTDRAYGNAFLALLPREVDWLKGLMEVSAHFGGEDCPYVFQFNGKQLSKLNTELRAAWHHAGMPGQISFSLIRTTIANQVRGGAMIREMWVCGRVPSFFALAPAQKLHSSFVCLSR